MGSSPRDRATHARRRCSSADCKRSERVFAERILPIDARVADLRGRMSALRPIPVIDGLLAATAKTYGMTPVTRNASNVEGLGANVLNPLEA